LPHPPNLRGKFRLAHGLDGLRHLLAQLRVGPLPDIVARRDFAALGEHAVQLAAQQLRHAERGRGNDPVALSAQT
jgi:hypothetical protein